MNEAAFNPLALLLDFENQVRALQSLPELTYFIANETHKLSPYRQAIVFDAQGKVLALSGVATVESNAPFVQWLQGDCWAHIRELDTIKSEQVNAIAGTGADWLPAFVSFFPLIAPNGKKHGMLMLAREKAWQKDEAILLSHISQAYAYCWAQHMPEPRVSFFKRIPDRTKIAIGLCLILALLFPVKLSVLAQAEVVAKDPVVIRAPMTGIVEKILVSPNQQVKRDDKLVRLDQTDLKNQRRVAQKTLQSLIAQYRQTARLALTDPKGRQSLTAISGRLKEQQAQISQLDEQLARTIITAPKAATVVLDKVEDWLGKPVQVGERILLLANENDLEVEAWLAVSDAIALEKGSAVKVFLNASPLASLKATIKYISYEAQIRPDGILAHRVLADISTNQTLPRLGARGTARLEGETVPFIYWMLRRPLATVRQYVGL